MITSKQIHIFYEHHNVSFILMLRNKGHGWAPGATEPVLDPEITLWGILEDPDHRGASRIPWSVNQGQTEDFPFYSYWELQSGIHENWTMERDRKIKCNWSMKAAELHCQRFHFKNTWFRQHSNQQPSTHFRHNFQGLGMRLKPPLGRH